MAKRTQDELPAIFDDVREAMKPYECGTNKARLNIQGKYDLWSEKDLTDPSGRAGRADAALHAAES